MPEAFLLNYAAPHVISLNLRSSASLPLSFLRFMPECSCTVNFNE